MFTSVLNLVDNAMILFTWLLSVFGIIGNYYTFKIYSTKRLRKNNLSLYFRAISVMGSMLLLIMISQTSKLYFNETLEYVHASMCKLVNYIGFSLGSMVAWLLVVISLDRFMNIAFPKRMPFLSNQKFQLAIIIFIIIYDLSFYSIILINFDLVVQNMTDPITNETIASPQCINYAQLTLGWMDLFNSTIMPFFFMIIFTLLLIYYIRKTRSRVSGSLRVDKEKNKDRKFTITALTLNVIFLTFNLPLVIFNIMSSYNLTFDPDVANSMFFVVFTIFNSFFGIDFYAQFFSNSIFRDRFLQHIGYKLTKYTHGDQTASLAHSQTQAAKDNIESE